MVVAEDSFLVREGIRHALARTPCVEVVGTAGTPAELRTALERTRPDVVLASSEISRELETAARGFALVLVSRGIADADELVAALAAAAAGQAPPVERDPFDELTVRQHEVLALVADGLSNEAIAERLVITPRAVERHINAIFARLRLEDSKDANRRVLAALLHARATEHDIAPSG